jgi:tRNA(Ile)-lysidine synthase
MALFYDRVKQEIANRKLIGKQDHVLVGVSGGPDSIALLHVLHRLSAETGFSVGAVHVNHQLRGEESEEDARFVREFCRSLALSCDVVRVDVSGKRKELGGNKQAIARQLRYDAFQEVARKRKATKLALAHHADDQLETVMMRLIRGTGVSGLAGMEWERRWQGIGLIRPLLGVTKEEIEHYCREQGLHPRLDSSNLSNDYTRNRLRHELVPLIHSFNPRVADAVLRLSELIREEEKIWEKLTLEAADQVVAKQENGQFLVDVSSFLHLPVALQRRVVKLILSYLWDYGTHEVTLDSVEQVRNLAQLPSPSAMIHLPGGIIAQREYEKLILKVHSSTNEQTTPILSETIPLSIPGVTSLPGLLGKIEVLETDEPIHRMRMGPNSAVFDRDKLKEPLYVRFRRPGDKMKPLGMTGRKKVKSLMMEAKVPKRIRDQYPLVVTKDEIVWIPGIKRSGAAPVTPDTRRFLYLHWHAGDGPNREND